MPITSRNIWYYLKETDHSPVREIALTRRINGSCLDETLRLSGGNLPVEDITLTWRRHGAQQQHIEKLNLKKISHKW